MAPNAPSSEKSFTKADLAFIDAAIAMQKATTEMTHQGSSGGPTVSMQSDLFIGVIGLVVAAVQVATFVYHAVKGSINVREISGFPTGVSTTASLQELITQRNALAKALGDTSVLK